MPKPTTKHWPEIMYCACGCGEIVPKHKYPSRQNIYINTHQHRGKHNGNYRGGKMKVACPICNKSFHKWPAQNRVTCGGDKCYKEWQRMTTSARGINKVETQCEYCKRTLWKWASQIKERNYCNRYCLAAGVPKTAHLNGNWRGGKWRFIRDQALIRDDYACVICGFNFDLHVHHITPLADGGDNSFSNLITLCPNHHAMVHSGIIDVEHLRNHEWEPSSTTDPTPHANR